MVGQFFQALTAGFSRFILAWLVPSIATVGLFCLILYPQLAGTGVLTPFSSVATAGQLDRALMFGFAALLLALVFSLASRPLYRLLEGYTGPRWLRRRMLRKQVRQWHVLRRQSLDAPNKIARGLLREAYGDYPDSVEDLLPTRLGNAFRALETYGSHRFGIDSQSLWYELHAVAPDKLRQDVEDARAAVDFFISFVAHLLLLAVVSATVLLTRTSGSALLLTLLSLAASRLAYNAAVRNMTDFRYTVQALINVGRSPLIEKLGYTYPTSAMHERVFWKRWSAFVRGDQKYLSPIDGMRAAIHGPAQDSKGEAPAAS